MKNFIADLLSHKVRQLETDAARWAWVRDKLTEAGAGNITEVVDRLRSTEADDRQARTMAREEAIMAIRALEASTGEWADHDRNLAKKLRQRHGWTETQFLNHPADYMTNL